MNSLVEKVEARFIGRLRELANTLSNLSGGIRANVYSHSVGAATDLQGHSIGIECLFLFAPDNEPDNVALSIDLEYLTTTPHLSAGVCWGHPSGRCEACFPAAGSPSATVLVSEANLGYLDAELPAMVEAFVGGVARRTPRADPHAFCRYGS